MNAGLRVRWDECAVDWFSRIGEPSGYCVKRSA